MNTTAPFQPFRPELSLKRRDPSATQPPMEYEGSTPLENAGHNSADPYGHAALRAAWDKLYRARSLLEAEQTHVRDDRIAIQGEIEALCRREDAVAAREAHIQQLELKQTLEKQEAEDVKESRSTIAKLTQAPFDMARSVFGSKK
jgi:hypothetical protein